jgi:hypothetical protein
LSWNPNQVGESRDPPERVEFFGRLTVLFRPASDGRAVYVVGVRLRNDH